MNIKIRPMRQSDTEAVLEMMRVFYDSPAVFHTSSDAVLKKDIEDCIGASPFVEGFMLLWGNNLTPDGEGEEIYSVEDKTKLNIRETYNIEEKSCCVDKKGCPTDDANSSEDNCCQISGTDYHIEESGHYIEETAADAPETIVGYAMTAPSYTTEYGGMCIWLEDLYINPQYRGLGIGSCFFRYMKEHYPEAVRFKLEVEPENERAVEVYKKNGYGVSPYWEMTLEMTEG